VIGAGAGKIWTNLREFARFGWVCSGTGLCDVEKRRFRLGELLRFESDSGLEGNSGYFRDFFYRRVASWKVACSEAVRFLSILN